MSPDYGLIIAEAFQKYLKTGDKALIERYSAKELKNAISRLSPYYDNNKQWYRSLEQRIEELEHLESRRRNEFSLSKILTTDRIIAFCLGLMGGLLL